MSRAIKRVVLVGHCGADSGTLRYVVTQASKDVEVTAVNDAASLARVADGETLLLVNRVLDGSFSTGSGVELIRSLASQGDRPVMMLISNYDDAQQQAVAAGACQGFGKSAAYNPETLRIVCEALGSQN